MDDSPDSPRVTGFDMPSISSWPIGVPGHVFALLNCVPSSAWAEAFHAEVGRAGENLRAACPLLESDRVAFLALPSNVGSLRVEINELIRRVGGAPGKPYRH